MTRDPEPGRPLGLRRAALGSALVAVAALLFVAFPPFSDGAFSIIDGIVYGAQLEDAGIVLPEIPTIWPEHALFHLLAMLVHAVLEGLDVAHPGHVAVRVLSSVGGALVLLLVCRNAAPRYGVGCAFALLVLCTRVFLIEGGVGESTLPAVAATLLVAELATRTPLSLWKLGVAFTLALFMRQDSVLFTPGLALAMVPALPPGRRVRTLVAFFGTIGAVAIAGYAALWWLTARELDPWVFLFGMGQDARPFNRGAVAALGFSEARLAHHASNLGACVLGRHHAAHGPGIALGAAYLGAVLAAGRLLRGSEPAGRYAKLVGATLAVWLPFTWWYSPTNWESHIYTAFLTTALASRMARGAPRTGPVARRLGVGLAVATALATLAIHGPTTLRLRSAGLMGSVAAARDAAGDDCEYVPTSIRAYLAVRQHGLPAPLPQGPQHVAAVVAERLGQGAPLVVVHDVFAVDGMPVSLGGVSPRLLAELERLGATPVFHEGRLCAAAFGIGAR